MNVSALERARSLVGCRFRPQGRDPDLGLDCIGLVCVVLGISPDAVPRDYRLRGDAREQLEAHLARFFKTVAPASVQPGDVLLLEAGNAQLHLVLLTERGFIHADAAIRRIVETPGAPPWATISAHRHGTGEI